MLSSNVNNFSTVRYDVGFTECLSIGLDMKNRIMEIGIMATTHISYSSHSSPKNKMIDCFTFSSRPLISSDYGSHNSWTLQDHC